MAEFYLRPLPGAEALRKFIKVSIDLLPKARFQTLTVDTNLLSPHLQILNSVPTDWESRTAGLATVLGERDYCRCTKISASANDQQNNQARFVLEYIVNPDGISAKVVANNLDALSHLGKDPIALADAVYKEFPLIRPDEIFLNALPDAQKKQLQVYERAISDLTAQAAKMQDSAGKIAIEQAEYFRKRSEEMDKELVEKRGQLQQQYDQATQDLRSREAAFSKKVEEFELREGTAVRRDLAKRIREEIAKASDVTISSYPRSQRYIVHIVCLPVLAFLAITIGLGVERTLSKAESVGTYLPLIGITVLFATMLWFYLRFNYIWADRMAQAELTTQKYARDFKRADWLTELICEYSKEGVKEFPPEVAARLAQNLFTEVQWGKQNVHPGDDVLEFLNRVSKFRSTKDGVELELASEGDKKR